jgi:hypothetical protein
MPRVVVRFRMLGSRVEGRDRGALSILVYTSGRLRPGVWRAKAMRPFHSVGANSLPAAVLAP